MNTMRIAIQGERGSFHEVAANQYFYGLGVDLVTCSSFDLTIDSVVKKTADLAVIAIENARSGSILYNYSLLRESGLKIIGEHNLRIEQNLMTLPGQVIEDISEIWSHPIAIAQCHEFLNRFPDIRLIEKEDTAGSARIIRDTGARGIAAIGARLAAELYELQVLVENIETNKLNYTRFLILSREMEYSEGINKASVCFALEHEPGSLASLLTLLSNEGINLTKIQSVPRMMMDWEYLFYLDLEFGGKNNLYKIFDILNKNTRDLEVLGVYKKRQIIYDS